MPSTLRTLMLEPAFGLRLLAGAGVADPVLDEPITWVHSSDLVDPTPWLEEGQLLLTDGVHFASDSPAAFSDPYVQRLRARGILALGFATDIAHREVPPSLVDACERLGLPLVEVADRTPFMAIIRHVADVIAGERQERLEWSLRAQRAVARAALRPDGLGAILSELEHQLGCWVALYDSLGNRVRVGTSIDVPEAQAQVVNEAVRTSLARKTRAGVRLSAVDGDVTLQTLGQSDRLRGVLAVGTTVPLDLVGNDLVASVIGLASIALEQRSDLEDARHQLREGVLELLLAGVIDVAGRTVQRLWGALPAAPVRVAVVVGERSETLRNELEVLAENDGGHFFFADRDGRMILVTSDGETSELERILGRHKVFAGISAPVQWQQLTEGMEEARRAGRWATSSRALVRYDALSDVGMLGLLEDSGASAFARRILEPLLERDDGELLRTAVEVWLGNNCAWDPAAKVLGVHRHTLRNRVSTVEVVLGLDFDRFADRAELWAALHFLRAPTAPAARGARPSSAGSPD